MHVERWYTRAMKNTLVVLAVIIVAGLGYYYFMLNPSATPETPSGAEGKLDINAVCEGALAYKTFPDGASADVFVQECKEGKHPDVIEDYKDRMGLGDGVAI